MLLVLLAYQSLLHISLSLFLLLPPIVHVSLQTYADSPQQLIEGDIASIEHDILGIEEDGEGTNTCQS